MKENFAVLDITPEITPLSDREIAITHIMKANPESVIESFYIDGYLNCYCKFKGQAIIQDFTAEMQMANGVFN